MCQANVIFGPVYYFVFLITMTLIVINLFIGIIAMAYETNTAHQYETEDGIVPHRSHRSWEIFLSCIRNTLKHFILLGWLDNVRFASSADPGYRFETGFSKKHSPDPEYEYLSANATHLSKIHEKHGYLDSAHEFVWCLTFGSHRIRLPCFSRYSTF